MKVFLALMAALRSGEGRSCCLSMFVQFNWNSQRRAKPGGLWKWILLFVGFPLLELWLILKLGAVMGWGVTLWLILMTGVIGGTLGHRQGFATIQKIQQELGQGRMPAGTLFEGLLILVAGLVLITPGILTDSIGFCLLIPPIRKLICHRLVKKVGSKFQVPPGAPPASGARPAQNLDGDDVIDV